MLISKVSLNDKTIAYKGSMQTYATSKTICQNNQDKFEKQEKLKKKPTVKKIISTILLSLAAILAILYCLIPHRKI